MTSTVERAAVDVAAPVVSPPKGGRRPWWMAAALSLGVAAGLILRFTEHSQLWLDEALTVDIARLPLRQLPNALRHDGAPPLYYALLHVWMRVFGTGDVAVRALSGVFAVALLPAVYLAARRLADRRVGWAAVLIVASSPFANHYATETRMYSLVALLAVLAYLAVANALERPTPIGLAWVALVTAALLYTHYWSIYLLTAIGAWILWRIWRPTDGVPRRVRLQVLGAMAVGAAAFLPWVPIFLFQAAHTGTPWSKPADFGALVSVITEFSGGSGQWAQMLAFVLFSLALLGLFGRAIDHHRVELDLRTLPRARGLVAVLLGTPAIAVAAGLVSGTAFVARYTSVVFPVFCLLVALGVSAFADRRVAAVVLGLATVLGLWCSLSGALWAPRTQAGDLAAAIRADARPGDVVAFCPDQLGPAVDRLLPPGAGLSLVTYPRGTPPGLINWVDYGDAVAHSSVSDFAQGLVARAGAGHDVWLVAGKGYRPFNGRCNTLVTDLGGLRLSGSVVVAARPIHYFEHATLYRFSG